MPTIKFPYYVISGAAGEYAKLYNSYLEPPLEFFYMSYLTCLGSAVADKITIASELKPQPRLYTLLLGESADDRKSTAIEQTLSIFKGYINICDGVGSAEGLGTQLKEHPKTLLFWDEFKQFISKCSIQSSVLLPCINKLFESNRYGNKTKHSSIEIENGRLSMLAASTIETYERTWEPEFTDIGFNNRLFLVPATGKRKKFLPDMIPGEEKYRMRNNIQMLIKTVKNDYVYPIEKDVREKMQEWYLNMSPSPHSKRLDGYAHRLMCLLTLNDNKTVIDMDIGNKVMDLIDWQFNVRQTHDPIDADSNIAKMEIRIRRQLKTRGELSRRDLKRYCHADRSGLWVFQNAIKNLDNDREIEAQVGRKGKIRLRLDDEK